MNGAIERFKIGNPFPTEAVVKKVKPSNQYFPFLIKKKENSIEIILEIEKHCPIWGLGQSMGGIDKRGGLYRSYNKDEPNHTDEKLSLYSSHNQLIFPGENPFMIFIDMACAITYDIGFTSPDVLKITVEKPELDLYFLENKSMESLISDFIELVGKPYVPAQWGLGHHQCRFSYYTSDEVREVAAKFNEAKIPCDAINLDIDYMDEYRNFTFHKTNFADYKELIQEMKNQDIKIVPIIDAGIKKEKGYPIYDDGSEKGYFCPVWDGDEEFVAAVWPGYSTFTDVLNKEARDWFADQYKILIDLGIEGAWNDMNEPSTFYYPELLDDALEHAAKCVGKNLGVWDYEALEQKFFQLRNNKKAYTLFAHNTTEGKVRHCDVHNMYGYKMLQAAGEGFERHNPKRSVVYGRSTMIGAHRYAGIWLGDNQSWWSHLAMCIQLMPNVNMAGFLYSGCDVGGFGANTNPELITRWYQFSIFSPLFRNHSSYMTRHQEAYAFDSVTTKNIKKSVELRYALLPHIYSEYLKVVRDNKILFKPLGFEYSDSRSMEITDQLLWGDSIMLTPVYEQNKTGRYVYLPEDMLLVRLRAWDNFTTKEYKAGDHYIDFDIDEMVFWIRKGKAVVMGKPALRVKDINREQLMLISSSKEKVIYNYLEELEDKQDWKSHVKELIIEVESNNYTIVKKDEGISVKSLLLR